MTIAKKQREKNETVEFRFLYIFIAFMLRNDCYTLGYDFD